MPARTKGSGGGHAGQHCGSDSDQSQVQQRSMDAKISGPPSEVTQNMLGLGRVSGPEVSE